MSELWNYYDEDVERREADKLPFSILWGEMIDKEKLKELIEEFSKPRDEFNGESVWLAKQRAE